MNFRRISLFAGPGAGKSTACAHLFSELKLRKYNIEQVTEYVKGWAILKREIKKFHQVYFISKQMNKEFECLSNGIDYIISDSPLPLAAFYSKYYREQGVVTPGALLDLACSFENQYPSLNIFLSRGDKEYRTEGRYQTPEEAYYIDNLILEQWPEYISRFEKHYGRKPLDPNLHVFDYCDYKGMLKFLESKLAPEDKIRGISSKKKRRTKAVEIFC